jgi:hypothetical protein
MTPPPLPFLPPKIFFPIVGAKLRMTVTAIAGELDTIRLEFPGGRFLPKRMFLVGVDKVRKGLTFDQGRVTIEPATDDGSDGEVIATIHPHRDDPEGTPFTTTLDARLIAQVRSAFAWVEAAQTHYALFMETRVCMNCDDVTEARDAATDGVLLADDAAE